MVKLSLYTVFILSLLVMGCANPGPKLSKPFTTMTFDLDLKMKEDVVKKRVFKHFLDNKDYIKVTHVFKWGHLKPEPLEARVKFKCFMPEFEKITYDVKSEIKIEVLKNKIEVTFSKILLDNSLREKSGLLIRSDEFEIHHEKPGKGAVRCMKKLSQKLMKDLES